MNERPIPFDDFPRPPFPVKAFPATPRRFVVAVALWLQVPVALVALLVLAAVAAA